jgi:hypothetical protein
MGIPLTRLNFPNRVSNEHALPTQSNKIKSVSPALKLFGFPSWVGTEIVEGGLSRDDSEMALIVFANLISLANQ